MEAELHRRRRRFRPLRGRRPAFSETGAKVVLLEAGPKGNLITLDVQPGRDPEATVEAGSGLEVQRRGNRRQRRTAHPLAARQDPSQVEFHQRNLLYVRGNPADFRTARLFGRRGWRFDDVCSISANRKPISRATTRSIAARTVGCEGRGLPEQYSRLTHFSWPAPSKPASISATPVSDRSCKLLGYSQITSKGRCLGSTAQTFLKRVPRPAKPEG